MSMVRPVTSIPRGSSDRIASLTSWPTTGGPRGVELLGTEAASEQIARHKHPETGLLALGRHQDKRHQVAATRHAVPAGRQRQATGPERAQGR